MNERMVVIRTFGNEFEADLARAELEAADIPVFINSHGTGGVHPNIQFAHGIRLAVPESQAEYALEILDTPFDGG